MLIRTSSTHRQYTRKANKTLQIYQSKNPREHDVDWLVEHGELIQDAFRPAHAKVISLDSDVTSVDDDTPASMYDTLVGLPELHRFQPIPDSDVSSETLDTIIAKIEDKRIVTILRNELCDADHHLPLRVMGAKLGLSQERVRQLKTQGYKIMRFELKKLGLVPEWAAEG